MVSCDLTLTGFKRWDNAEFSTNSLSVCHFVRSLSPARLLWRPATFCLFVLLNILPKETIHISNSLWNDRQLLEISRAKWSKMLHVQACRNTARAICTILQLLSPRLIFMVNTTFHANSASKISIAPAELWKSGFRKTKTTMRKRKRASCMQNRRREICRDGERTIML